MRLLTFFRWLYTMRCGYDAMEAGRLVEAERQFRDAMSLAEALRPSILVDNLRALAELHER